MNVKIFDFKMLTESQIGIIFSRLAEAPKLYETEDMKVKEVAVKLFNPHMTLYVLEYDEHTKVAFGYVKNELDPSLSEWGYSSLDLMMGLGFEMDLYFENRVIDFEGNIHDKEVLDV